MSGGSMLKTLAMAALGLLLGMIGIDAMSGYTRFSFGVVELGDGIGIVPVAVGLFGISEILLTAGQATPPAVQRPKLRELMPVARGSRERPWADRARQPARLPDRHHPGLGAHHLVVRVVRHRAAHLEAPRAVRQGRDRRRGGSGIGQQRGGDRRLRADAGARHSDRSGHGGDDRRDDGARHLAGADADPGAARALLGLRREHVRRQRRAADAQSAAGRPVREPAAHSVFVSLSRASCASASSACYSVGNSVVDVWIMLVMGARRLRAAQVRLRPRAGRAGAGAGADAGAVAAPVARDVGRQLRDLLHRPIAVAMFAAAAVLILLGLKPLIFKSKNWREKVGLEE